jgi:hypothetical protein
LKFCKIFVCPIKPNIYITLSITNKRTGKEKLENETRVDLG